MPLPEDDPEVSLPTPHRGLRYPFTAPATGERLVVAPGVAWLRMPLPYDLNHINVWALDDCERWALVDTGTRTEAVAAAWHAHLDPAAGGRPLSRVIVTHMHPDHVGMAGWLTRNFAVPLWMTRLEYLTCRVMTGDTGREAPVEALDFYRRAGWGEPAIQAYRVRFGNFGKHIHPLPDSFRRLRDNDEIRIGANDWRVIVGTGHSPEHACLYSPALKVFIAGDQVLPRISSNVSVHPIEPDADPMADWLRSLDRLQREVPNDVLVLPSHNDCFHGLHERLEALRSGQHRALDRLRGRLAEQPRRAVDVFGALFARHIEPGNVPLLGMATGEALACLNYLRHRGEILADTDAQGVAWYRMA